jgi:O-antigen/teichoic acid export membrane protein
LQNAAALTLSTGGTGALGIVFWAAAARMASPSAVGDTTAEISAMVLLANLAQLSLTTIFERFLPIMGNRTGKFVKTAYAICVMTSLIAAIIYLAAGFGEKYIPTSLGWRALFVVAVILWTIFVIQDSVLTALRATRWVPVENILFALAKLALLPAFILVSASQGIFLAWTVPVVAATATVSWFAFGKLIPKHESSEATTEEPPSTRQLISLGFAQYASLLISQLSTSVVALIVIQRLGPIAEAHYYVPALISNGGVAVILWSLVTSFLVEASYGGTNGLRHNVNVTMKAVVALVVPSIVIGVAFAPQILSIFGTTYAHQGTTLLRLLLLSLPGVALTAFFNAMAWLDRRVWWLAARELMSSVIFFVVLFTLIGHFGIVAIGIATLVSSGVLGVLLLPVSIRRYRMTRDSDTAPADDSKSKSQ